MPGLRLVRPDELWTERERGRTDGGRPTILRWFETWATGGRTLRRAGRRLVA